MKPFRQEDMKLFLFNTLHEGVSLPNPFSPRSPHPHSQPRNKIKTCQNQEVPFHPEATLKPNTNG